MTGAGNGGESVSVIVRAFDFRRQHSARPEVGDSFLMLAR
jgi:hypothetical protein